MRRLADKPLVLLGVNGDEDRDMAKKVVRGQGRPGGPGGRRQGGSDRQPVERPRLAGDLRVIDHQGIIRHKWNESPGAEPLEKAVSDELSLPRSCRLPRMKGVIGGRLDMARLFPP